MLILDQIINKLVLNALGTRLSKNTKHIKDHTFKQRGGYSVVMELKSKLLENEGHALLDLIVFR